MTRTGHAKFVGALLRGLAVVAALGGVQVAHAINKAGMSGFRSTVSDSGKVASIRPNQAGAGGSTGSVGAIPQGQVGSQIGNSGWYVGASGSGNPSGQTMTMAHTGDVFFAGTKYPFQAGYQVGKNVLVEALGVLCKNPVLCLAAAGAGPALDWLTSRGVQVNQNPADYPDKPFLQSESFDGQVYRASEAFPWSPTKNAACNYLLAEIKKAQSPSWNGGMNVQGDFCVGTWGSTYRLLSKPATIADVLPRSMSDISPYMDLPETPAGQARLINDLLDKGAEIKLPDAPTVTGPGSVEVGKKETVNPDGSKTTTTTTNNYKTDGNKITNTSTVTTTQSCIGDGACSPVTTTTETTPTEPGEQDERSECEKNPDSLNCADLDTPDGEIPKSTFDVSYSSEDSWGAGSCPAQVYGTINGQSTLLYDWAQTCSIVATYIRPLLLVMCAFGALMIVAPIGGKA